MLLTKVIIAINGSPFIFMELIDKVFDPDILIDSYYEIRKAIRFKSRVQYYGINLLDNVLDTCKDFVANNHKYVFKALYEFMISERGKIRDIKATHFYDRVPIHAFVKNILEPIIRKKIIYDNCASLKGRGITMQRNRLKVHLQRYFRKYGNKGYVLRGDYKNYFGSINHKQVEKIFEDKIEPETMAFLKDWMNQYGEIGLGIGGEPSQTVGVVLPTRVDNYIKTVKRCKYYGRYMDDFYIFHPDKKFLQDLLQEIIIEADKIDLKLNKSKTSITPINKPFTFLKIRYTLTDTGKIIMKHTSDTFTRERRKLKKFKNKLNEGKLSMDDIEQQYKSWYGGIKRYNNHKSLISINHLYNELFKKGGEEVVSKVQTN